MRGRSTLKHPGLYVSMGDLLCLFLTVITLAVAMKEDGGTTQSRATAPNVQNHAQRAQQAAKMLKCFGPTSPSDPRLGGMVYGNPFSPQQAVRSLRVIRGQAECGTELADLVGQIAASGAYVEFPRPNTPPIVLNCPEDLKSLGDALSDVGAIASEEQLPQLVALPWPPEATEKAVLFVLGTHQSPPSPEKAGVMVNTVFVGGAPDCQALESALAVAAETNGTVILLEGR